MVPLQQERESRCGGVGGGCFKFNYQVLIWRHLQSPVRSVGAHPDGGFLSVGLVGGGGVGATWRRPSVAQQASSKVEVLILTGVLR